MNEERVPFMTRYTFKYRKECQSEDNYDDKRNKEINLLKTKKG